MRSVPEWIGKNDDETVPRRVRLRVFDRAKGWCASCTRIVMPHRMQIDHTVALCNGGQNRESNLQLLCKTCHFYKTGRDVGARAKADAIKAKFLGLAPPSRRPMPHGKSSSTKKKITGEVVER